MRNKSDLWSHQQRLVTRMYESPQLLAVLRMGAGKTASALTAIEELQADEEIRHALVLAPKRVAEHVWRDETRQWKHLHRLDVETLTGDPTRRLKRLLAWDSRDVTICGIDNLQWLVDELVDWSPDHPIFDLLVIDETSRFKDPTGKRGKALSKIRSRFKSVWGLTGTPRPNSALDLWGPMRLIAPGLWPSFYKWRGERFRALDFKGYRWEALPGAEAQINAEVAPVSFILQENEMPDLPKLSVIIDRVELPPSVWREYLRMERELT